MSDTSWMLDIGKPDQEVDPADKESNSVNPPLPIPEDDPIETSIDPNDKSDTSWMLDLDTDDGYEPVVPRTSGLVKDPGTDPSYMKDFVLSAGVGLTNGIEETLDTIGDLTGETGIETLDYVLDPNNRLIPRWYKSKTGLGVATEGISRFLGGFGLAGKGLKAAGWANKVKKGEELVEISKKSKFARGMTAGAAADFFVIDPAEGRLTDMLDDLDNPYLDIVVFDFLKSEDNDSVLEGKVKNVIEGMMLGGLIEGLLMIGMRGIKAARKTPEKAQEIYEKTAKKIEEHKKSFKGDDEINIFHGTDETFENFDVDKTNDGTVWFTDRKDLLEGSYDGIGKKKNIMHRTFKEGELNLADSSLEDKYMIQQLIDMGYDGVKYIREDGETVYQLYESGIKKIKNPKPKVKTRAEKINDVETNPAINTRKAIKRLRTSKENADKDSKTFLDTIINIDNLKSGKHVLKTIEDAVNLFDDETLEYLTTDVLTNQNALELATLLGRNVEEVLAALPKDAEYARQSTIRMIAAKQVIQRIGKQTQEMAKEVSRLTKLYGRAKITLPGQKAYRNWPEEAQKVVRQYEEMSVVLADSTYYLKEQVRNAARLTQAGRVKVGLAEGKLDIERLVDDIENYKGDALSSAGTMANYTPAQVVKQVGKTKGRLAVETFNSLYTNSLLSSPWTNAINLTSGIYEALLRPLENAVGATLQGDLRGAAQAFGHYQGMLQSYKDIWRATKLSFQQSDAVLDKKFQTIETKGRGRTISAANYNMQEGLPATMVDWVGKYLELPGQLLTSGDELLKQANYRGRIHASSVKRMTDEGIQPGSPAWKEGLEKDMDNAFAPDGSAAVDRNPMAAEAVQYARESTFTNTLKDGSYLGVGENLEKFFNNVPALRFMAPFIRTPTNLWRHVANRFPILGRYTKQNSEKWATGDPRARAEILGQQVFGVAATAMGYMYATSDVVITDKNGKQQVLPRITGKGIKNKGARDLLMATGWQPYSILMNKGTEEKPEWTYVQYNRTDPRFFMFGIMADIVEVSKLDPTIEGIPDYSIAIIQSIARNMTDKTYTKGISDALELMGDPTGGNVTRFGGNLINNVIPYSGMRRFLVQEFGDGHSYEVRNATDVLLANVGLTDTLEPKRDWKGDPIIKARTGFFMNDGLFSGVTMSPSLIGRGSVMKDSSDNIYVMAKLLSGVAGIEKKSLHKDLDISKYTNSKGQTALDYWRENIGKVRVNGMKIDQFMKTKMKSSEFLNAGTGDPNDPGGREYLMAKYYQAFKLKSRNQLLQKGSGFKDEEGNRLSDTFIQERKDKWRFFKRDAPHIREDKKKKIDRLIGF